MRLDCNDIQLFLTELLDDRPLNETDRRAVEEHVVGCPECARASAFARATKSLLAERFAPVPAPPNVTTSVQTAIEREMEREEGFRRASPTGSLWNFFKRKPAVAAGAALAVAACVWFFTPQPSKEQLFNESKSAYIAADFHSFDCYLNGSAKLQIETHDTAALRSFFVSHGIDFIAAIPVLQSAAILGGMITHCGTVPVAHVIYRIGDKTFCVCQMRMADVQCANNLGISDSARHCLNAGVCYWYCDSAHKHSIALWKNGDTFCSLTANSSPSAISFALQGKD